MISTRLLAPTLLIATMALPGQGRAATPTGPKVASDEVYLDVSNSTFGGRLSYGSGETAIAIIEPVGTNATLFHWPSADKNCAVCPDKVRRRAGAPTGAPVGGMQKLVFKVGPLWAGRTHCFKVIIKRLAPLSSRERLEVDNALLQAVGDLGDQKYTGQMPGCRVSGKARILSCQVVWLFRKALGWTRDQTLTDRPGRDGPGNIYTELGDTLASDPGLRALVAKLVLARENRKVLNQTVTKKLGWLDTEGKKIPADGVIYDPLYGVTSREVKEGIVSPALAAKIPDALLAPDQRKALLNKLWALGAELKLVSAWRADMRADALKAIKSFFGHKGKQPRRVVLTNEQLLKATKAMRESSFKDRVALLKSLENVFPPSKAVTTSAYPNLAAQPPSTEEKQVLLKRLAVLVSGLKKTLADEKIARDTLQGISGDKSYKEFTARVKSVHRVEGAPVHVTPEPTFKERFPLYVTADLGVAMLVLAPGVYDAVQYFGINIYLANVDKEEPLNIDQWSCHDIKRRFSFTVGIHLLSPGLHGDEVTGLVGSRMLMAGAGLRLLEHVRLSGGAVFYGQPSQNPLVDETHFRAGGFMGLSLDLDVIGTVAGWFSKTKIK